MYVLEDEAPQFPDFLWRLPQMPRIFDFRSGVKYSGALEGYGDSGPESNNRDRDVVMNRRLFMTLSATGLATRSWMAVPRALPVSPATKARIKAVAFDAFPIFDPRPVFALAEELFPGTGLSDEWRTRQFASEYFAAARTYTFGRNA
jgi:hypothetical protein